MTNTPLALALKTRLAQELAPILGQEITQADANVILDAVDEVLAEFDGDDPRPFPHNARVRHRDVPEVVGAVAKRVEENGELHTLWVRWEGADELVPHSPRELVAE